MSVLNVDYTFRIVSAELDNSTVLIEFNPLDDDCMPIQLNCNILTALTENFEEGLYANPEDIPFEEHLKWTAKLAAPTRIWMAQKWAVLNSAALAAQISSNTYISSS